MDNQPTNEFNIGNVASSIMDDLALMEPPAPDEPRVLFPSDLVLTRQQEDALCAAAKRWYERLDMQLGRSESAPDSMGAPAFLTENTSGAVRPERKFMPKRVLYQLISQNDVSWRKALYPGSIFEKSNLTVPIARRISKQSAARAVNYFFGTDPWMAQFPIGGNDQELARKLQRLSDIKFLESGSLDVIRKAVAGTFDIGEAVMKVTFANRSQRYRSIKTVAINPADGTPYVASDGLPITKDDLWTLDEAGTQVLKRDGVTPMPAEGLIYDTQTLEQELTTYLGPEVTQIYFRDFLCPENAKSVQDAECVIHMMERNASQLAELFLSGGSRTKEGIQNAVVAIGQALAGSTFSKTGDRGARTELGQEENPETDEPVIEYGEFYLRYDADGDRVTEDIMILMNPETGYPIYYNYTANITDDGLRPFRVITQRRVMNRWYGQGSIEEFETHQMAADLQLNRRSFNQSAAGRITFWNPSATVEGDMDPSLKLNWGQTYRMKPGMLIDDALKVVYADDNKFERLTEELEFTMQIAMNESGVQNSNDAQSAGLETSKLATGIRNIEKSGQEMFAMPISELETGITAVAQAFVTTLYANMQDDETFLYFEGDVPQEITISARDVKNLRFNIQTLLTRFREEQVLQSNSQADALIQKFYSYPPELQLIVAPLYREMLKALQVPRADSYIIPMPVPLTPPGGEVNPQAPGQQGLAPPPNI